MKIMVINGPNLNMLGIREPAHYGKETYADLLNKIQKYADEKGVSVVFRQSNHEGKASTNSNPGNGKTARQGFSLYPCFYACALYEHLFIAKGSRDLPEHCFSSTWIFAINVFIHLIRIGRNHFDLYIHYFFIFCFAIDR